MIEGHAGQVHQWYEEKCAPHIAPVMEEAQKMWNDGCLLPLANGKAVMFTWTDEHFPEPLAILVRRIGDVALETLIITTLIMGIVPIVGVGAVGIRSYTLLRPLVLDLFDETKGPEDFEEVWRDTRWRLADEIERIVPAVFSALVVSAGYYGLAGICVASATCLGKATAYGIAAVILFHKG